MGQQKKMAAATERGFRGKKKVLAATVRGPRQKQKVHAAMGQRKKVANKKRPAATGRGFRQEGKHLRPGPTKKGGCGGFRANKKGPAATVRDSGNKKTPAAMCQ